MYFSASIQNAVSAAPLKSPALLKRQPACGSGKQAVSEDLVADEV
jgi:hypothetical protein